MVHEDERSAAALGEELFTAQSMSCPHALWRRMRDESPVPKVKFSHSGKAGYLVTRKQDIEFVASHPEIFSSEVDASVWRWGNDFGPEFADIFADGGYQPVHTIVTSDPPRAQKYRKIVLEALSPARIGARRPALQAIVDGLIGKLPGDGVAFDFRKCFAIPLPLSAIMDVFGLPESHADFIFEFSSDFLSLVDPTTPLTTARENAKSLVAAQKYLAPMIERYRAEPADNFLSFVANVRDDEGRVLSLAEALSIALITVIGGNETTRNALATAAYELARRKDVWSALKLEPAKVAAFAEEIVRYGSPATVTPRQLLQDAELAGTKMPKGAAVYILWGSGSHDERAFDGPESIRLDRKGGRNHTSFGFGVHHCAGIHLARAELKLSIEAWLREFESIDLAIPEAELHYAASWAIRALDTLPVTVTRTRALR